MILLDTHVLMWLVDGEERLGRQARERIAREARENGVLVSVVTAWELAMLNDKGRITLGKPTLRWFEDAIAFDGAELAPLEPTIAVAAGEFAGFHRDPADRMLVATAQHRDVALVTADQRILAYAAAGHLQAIDARH